MQHRTLYVSESFGQRATKVNVQYDTTQLHLCAQALIAHNPTAFKGKCVAEVSTELHEMAESLVRSNADDLLTRLGVGVGVDTAGYAIRARSISPAQTIGYIIEIEYLLNPGVLFFTGHSYDF